MRRLRVLVRDRSPRQSGGKLTGLLLMVAGIMTGCSSDAISRWKDAAERHVIDRHGGDLASLRGGTPEEDRFDYVGGRAGALEMFPANRDDVYGVLLPPWRSGNALWQPVLVGVVRFSGVLDRFPLGKSRVRDIRLVAAHVQGDELRWRSTPADAEALARYVGEVDRDGTTTFPAVGDQLEVEDVPGGLIVHERRSGASWTLLLSGDES